MPRVLILFITTLLTVNTASARKSLTEKAQPVVAEAWKLYRSEKASWHGTDLFVAANGGMQGIGGYLSYSEGPDSRCIFFSQDSTPKIIGSVSFDSSYDLQTAVIDHTERAFNPREAELYRLRTEALKIIRGDTFFKHYENTNLNVIPLIDGSDRKVYVLTGTSANGLVFFGNDYLLEFDKADRLRTKRRLHNNILPFEYGAQTQGGEITDGVHSHLPETGDFITATDICTLMLYADYTGWKQHTVISKNCVSIWNCRTRSLVVLPRKTMDKILKDFQKRHPETDKPAE